MKSLPMGWKKTQVQMLHCILRMVMSFHIVKRKLSLGSFGLPNGGNLKSDQDNHQLKYGNSNK
jgi:hypothetical protein